MRILCDIDHTVSDAAWRDEMIGKASWDEYHAASVNDKPIPGVRDILIGLKAAGHEIIGFTARPEKWRQISIRWLAENGVPMDEILMRPDTDYRPAPQIKMALAQEHYGENFADEIGLIIEDREDVVAAFRAHGITCIQIHCAIKVEKTA